MLALGLGGFLMLGMAHLPLLRRYLFPAGAALGLFCAVAILGWLLLERGTMARRGWALGALAAVAVVIGSVPSTARNVDDQRDLNATLGSAQRSLRALLSSDAGRSLVRACPRVMVGDIQLGLQVASAAHVPLSRIALDLTPARESGLLVAGRSAAARTYYVYENAFRTYEAGELPDFRLATSNEDWQLWARC
jgi:hypothetical protein